MHYDQIYSQKVTHIEPIIHIFLDLFIFEQSTGLELKLATFVTYFPHCAIGMQCAVQRLESNADCKILKFLGFIIMAA